MIMNMKKLSVLFAIGSLFAMTTMVFASDKPGMKDDSNDGIKWTNGTISNDNTNDKSINRTGYTTDGNDIKDQVASVKIDAKAYIPCYLKLELTGNKGKTTAESFGPKAEATGDADGYFMLFDNEVGGFVDSNWKVQATGKNAEIAPGKDVYIAACDTFKVEVYSNDDFKYEVVSAPLINKEKGKSLNLRMGTSNSMTGTYSNDTFDTSKTITIGKYPACVPITKFHKFAVPYATDTAQGEYTGTVTFKATTI